MKALWAAPAGPHDTRGSSILRPTVFGVTDGLVANACLIMGVAGASSEAPHTVVLAGIAGLVAGSFSMAMGEYISVRSQHELLDYQVELERKQLRQTPDQERAILVEIYRSRGLSGIGAGRVVDRLLADPKRALDTFVRDEIGLSAATMGSPTTAATGSLLAFAAGASVPLMPYMALSGVTALGVSIACTLAALFLLGLVSAVSPIGDRSGQVFGRRRWGFWLPASPMALACSLGLPFADQGRRLASTCPVAGPWRSLRPSRGWRRLE